MGKSATLSFTIPIELSIEMDLFMETQEIGRSQFIKEAIKSFLLSNKEKEQIPTLLQEIKESIIEMKSTIKEKL